MMSNIEIMGPKDSERYRGFENPSSGMTREEFFDRYEELRRNLGILRKVANTEDYRHRKRIVYQQMYLLWQEFRRGQVEKFFRKLLMIASDKPSDYANISTNNRYDEFKLHNIRTPENQKPDTLTYFKRLRRISDFYPFRLGQDGSGTIISGELWVFDAFTLEEDEELIRVLEKLNLLLGGMPAARNVVQRETHMGVMKRVKAVHDSATRDIVPIGEPSGRHRPVSEIDKQLERYLKDDLD